MENRMKKLTAAVLLTLALALPALAHEGGHTAYGVVKEVSAERLVITDEHGKDAAFALTAGTQYLRDHKAIPREKIAVGERVVVKGKDASGKMEATSVSVGAEMKHEH
jgi:hypothetical protein